MTKLFGTDGVRGIANQELSAPLAYEIGKAGTHVLAVRAHHRPKILVGVDTRISCDMLECALVSGILSAGGDAHLLGVIPTPAVAFLVREYNADAGIMISASHNPMEYNGIKFFDKDGFKLRDSIEEEIEGLIFRNLEGVSNALNESLGRKYICETALDDYCSAIMSMCDTDLSGLKILADCANGATYLAAQKTLSGLGASVTLIHNCPTGTNINKDCGSTHMDYLSEQLKAGEYDLGIAFDGDGDRMLAMTKEGELIDGDYVMAIMADFLKKKGRLKNNTIVGTVMSNLGLKIMCDENGIDMKLAKVGDRYVLENMLKGEYILGGEQSGHIILLEHNTTGDGIVSAVKLLEIIKETGMDLKSLSSIMKKMPQVLVNVEVPGSKKQEIMEDVDIQSKIRDIEAKMQKRGRVLLRPSGTEPLIRIMLEGENIDEIQRDANILKDMVCDRLYSA